MIYSIFFRDRGPFGGDGYLGGDPPSEDHDGRARIMNAPSRVLVQIHAMRDAADIQYVASVLSGPDGVWRLEGIDRSLRYRVIGVDLHGEVNSAIQDWVMPARIDP